MNAETEINPGIFENPLIAYLVWRDGGRVEGRSQFAVWYATQIRLAKKAAWTEGWRNGVSGHPDLGRITDNPYARQEDDHD